MVFEPTITCPIEFDFTVSLSTYDGSAGTYTQVVILPMYTLTNFVIIIYNNNYKFIDNYYSFLHKLAKLSS